MYNIGETLQQNDAMIYILAHGLVKNNKDYNTRRMHTISSPVGHSSLSTLMHDGTFTEVQ